MHALELFNLYISKVWFDLGSLYESCNCNQIMLDAIDAMLPQPANHRPLIREVLPGRYLFHLLHRSGTTIAHLGLSDRLSFWMRHDMYPLGTPHLHQRNYRTTPAIVLPPATRCSK